ncbi:MAG: tyrosine--tRNA ligase [Fimbriimonadaceae bacterium]|nr:tyrosine--tRNA ligase [Fimbriimonadaceae bacterium]
MNAFDVLSERGFVFQSTDPAGVRQMLTSPTTAYTGFDPTAASLHCGHLVPLMQLAWLQRCGNRPILLCGGGTALVGDPSGKTSSRPILTRDEINANLASQRQQAMRFMDFEADRALVANNADWLCELNYIDFLRDIGAHFSVNQMLTAEIYRTRLDADEHLSFLEFNYQLLQAYDWLHLYRTVGCTMQCAGSDQWANCLAGMDLIRRLEGAEAHVLCTPLLVTASGQKMGKTEKGAVWLDPELTPPYEFFQYWVNVDDRDVERLLKLLTFLSLAQIGELCSADGAALRDAKRVLAYEVTGIVHGQPAAEEAQAAAQALFGGGGGDRSAMPSTGVALVELAGWSLLDALVHAGLCASRGEARRLTAQGGAYVNEARVADPEAPLGEGVVQDGEVLLRAGKKRYHRLVVTG